MSDNCDLSFQQRSLFQQGYQNYSPQELKQLQWGLRFTPTVCSLLTLIGLVTSSHLLLFIVAALGFLAFFFPSGHPVDLVYNHIVRHFFGAVKLPANPFQRRLACLSAGVMNLVVAFLLQANMLTLAWIFGALLLSLQAIVIFSHFCFLSWLYEGVLRMFGQWHKPLDIESAKEILNKGGQLVDVRSPNEFSNATIANAVNLPLEFLEKNIDAFRSAPCLLFCNSGTRSHIAFKKLSQAGLSEVYNLGPMSHAKQLIE